MYVLYDIYIYVYTLYLKGKQLQGLKAERCRSQQNEDDGSNPMPPAQLSSVVAIYTIHLGYSWVLVIVG